MSPMIIIIELYLWQKGVLDSLPMPVVHTVEPLIKDTLPRTKI